MVRVAEVLSVLDEGALLLLSLRGSEALSRPFSYEVDLLSENEKIDFGALLGQPMGVLLELQGQSQRQFIGIVTEFAMVGGLGRYVRYRAVLRPWIWLLSKRTNCRVFQRRSVPDIVKEIFREHGFSDFDDRLTHHENYPVLDYVVQYRESDLNFVSRLLEHVGIYYFFRHGNGKHTLVLADSYSAHEPAPDAKLIRYMPPQQGQRRETEHFDQWSFSRRIRSGSYVGRDFDFEKPRAQLTPQIARPQEHAHSNYEQFDYPIDFVERSQGESRVQMRLEEQHVEYETVSAAGNVRALNAGHLFTLEEFPRADQNKEYLTLETAYALQVNGYESSAGTDSELTYRVDIRALDSKRQFRPARITPKPVIEGPQTALVVGDDPNEIWTDSHGRVKVQFHWDRLGKFDGDSSCWVRVSQLWAGSGFGGIHIPRIGQEVIVDFLEGDPDRPIITGRVYNQLNKPPYELPLNKTQSGIKSRSTLRGLDSNFNEIRFEDKKGQEELFIQAEKNQVTKVKVNQSVSVGANQSISVGANQSVAVTANQSVTVTGERTVDITKKDKETSHALRENFYLAERHTQVTTLEKLDVIGDYKTGVTQAYTLQGDGKIELNHASDQLKMEKALVHLKNETCELKLDGGDVTLKADSKLTLQCGGASITLTKDGTIEISGTQKANITGFKEVTVVGSTKVNIAGGGSKVDLDSGGATVTGTAVNLNT
ncbi:MAG TPA: type VI secretion system tip protein TssI/VgrG [Polyangiaceae bacterium]|nr:type VI secretion system tip protein TssI/VgrG [Polyangiaceae bacterium]